jgi:hypothetical protein
VVAATVLQHELLVNQEKPGPMPVFRDWQKELSGYHGLQIVYSRQCPWVARFINDIQMTLSEKGIKIEVTELTTAEQAQSAPSPSAVFSLIYNGRLLADHYISETRFMNILKKEKLLP